MPNLRTSASLVAITLVLAACGAASPAATPVIAPTVPPVAPSVASSPAAIASDPQHTPAVALEAWQTATLTDVRSGESFTIADLAGRLVVIEPMAIWCTNCARQQREASKALAALDSNDVVYISLDVDPGEQPADLAAYADERGFDWRFVVAGRDLSRALALDLGDQVLSPPSTPRIIVTQDGRVIGPDFGAQEAADLEADLRDLLG